MKFTHLSVRDLTATHPDDYPDQEYDVLAHCCDGIARHSDETWSDRGEAEAFMRAVALEGAVDLDRWTGVPAHKSEEQP